jgi:hypothetical protein
MADEEFTPRELGLLAGHAWAKTALPIEVTMAAEEGEMPEGAWETIMGAGMRDRLDEFEDSDAAEETFLEGFHHGVGAFVVEDLRRLSNLN